MAELTMGVTQVTPAWAQHVLDQQANYPQRRLDQGRVAQYARQMQEGRWELNGEPLQFNGGFRLLNGQHRLRAVVRAGVTVPILVVRGVDERAFDTMDQGKVRNVPDLLGLLGVKYKAEIGGGARIIMSYERGGTFFPVNAADRPVARDITEYVIAHREDIIEAAALASRVNVGYRSNLTALFFLGRARLERDTFAESLRDGIDLGRDNPVRLLRDRLLTNARALAKLEPDVIFALSIKAWNAFVGRQAMGILRWTKKEEYPVMVR